MKAENYEIRKELEALKHSFAQTRINLDIEAKSVNLSMMDMSFEDGGSECSNSKSLLREEGESSVSFKLESIQQLKKTN